jgi:hypothetical protein
MNSRAWQAFDKVSDKVSDKERKTNQSSMIDGAGPPANFNADFIGH